MKACTNHRLKILELCRIVFLSCKLWFLMEHIFCEFFIFGHVHIFFPSIVICTYLGVAQQVMLTSSCVHYVKNID